MFRKLIMVVLVVAALAVIADYLGYISLPWSQEQSTTLQSRDQYVNKTQNALDAGSD
jgi:hypothetical protein